MEPGDEDESLSVTRVRGDGQWHHLAISWSRAQDFIRAYLDSVRAGETTFKSLLAAAEGRDDVDVPPDAVVLRPLRVKAPEVAAKQRFRLHLAATVDGEDRIRAPRSEASELLRKLGLPPRRLGRPSELEASDLLTVHGRDRAAFAALQESAEDFRKRLAEGLALLIVRADLETPLNILPTVPTLERAEVFEKKIPADWPLLRGLGASDFFWRRTLPILMPSSADPDARCLSSGLVLEAPSGRGRVVLFQADEEIFDKPYDRVEADLPSSPILRRWVRTKIYRVLSTLLTNLEAELPVPEQLPDPSYASRLGCYVERGEPFHPMATRGW